MKLKQLVAAVAVAAGFSGNALSLPISNPHDSANAISAFGPTTTYGVVFTAPTIDNILDSFTFHLRSLSTTPTVFFGGVAEWDSAGSGATVFSSLTDLSAGPTTYSYDDTGAFAPVTVFTEGVTLTGGSRYVAYFSAISFGALEFGASDTGIESGFVYDNNDIGTPWDCDEACGALFPRLAFDLNFSGAVPEPASLALFGIGLLGLAAARRRKHA